MKITFFEKTGCINNTKQKEILSKAGHEVEAIDLIKYRWTAEELLSFFDGLEVKDWFNPNAPMVATDLIKPENFTSDEAIKEMLKEHLLIKRPLMIIGEQKFVGFDKQKLSSLLNLTENKNPVVEKLMAEDLSTCPQKQKNQSCDD